MINHMRALLPALTLTLLLLPAILSCASGPRSPRGSVSLPDASPIANQCSRPDPPQHESTWQPGPEDIRALEMRLGTLERIKARGCCLLDARIGHIGHYYLQYVGIVSHGRRLIYINGFEDDRPDWRTTLVSACDGGEGFWGAVFDPATGRFSDLAFNGLA
jgi:hypothetical protein